MGRIKDVIELIRVRQWTKNILVLVPAFFAGVITTENLGILLVGFFTFSLTSGLVYLINDWRDKELDKLHPKKKFRPIPQGKFNGRSLLLLSSLLMVLILGGLSLLPSQFALMLMAFFTVNILYSLGLKKVPYLEILIVASGFAFRIYAGGFLAEVPISKWLILLITFTALLIIASKRKSELEIDTEGKVRYVLRHYSLNAFEVLISILSICAMGAYLMYCLDKEVMLRVGENLYLTTGLVGLGMARYLQQVFVKKNSGAPAELFYKDKLILLIILAWLAAFYYFLYVG